MATTTSRLMRELARFCADHRPMYDGDPSFSVRRDAFIAGWQSYLPGIDLSNPYDLNEQPTDWYGFLSGHERAQKTNY